MLTTQTKRLRKRGKFAHLNDTHTSYLKYKKMKIKLYYLFLIFIIFSCENYENLTENQIELDQVKSSQTSRMSGTDDNLPMILPNNFIWGINGHPLSQAAYRDGGSTANMQVDLISEHMLSYYRIDFPTDSVGLIMHQYQRDEFTELINNLPNNIKLLPVLTFSAFDFQFSEDELYQKAKTQAEGFMIHYKDYFEYVAIGNEEELRCTTKDLEGNCIEQILLKDSLGNNQSGDTLSHYNLLSLKKVASYLKGLSDGIKLSDSSKKIIINNGGPKHYGFNDYIDSYTLNGESIQYDITGLHWYDYNQNIVSIAQNRYSKPNVWITESHKHSGSYNNSESSQANIVNDMINQLHNQSNIQAYFLYEIYNEPSFGNVSEAHYGIVKWETQYSDFNYKPASEVIKFKIEESTFGFEDYVHLFYERVNLSQPDVEGLNYWTIILESNRNKLDFLNNILPQKNYELFVKEQYLNLLDRSSDSGGLTYWVARMKNGFTREDLILEFCVGTEFWNKSGQTNSSFIQRLYLKLLGRPADSEGLTFWLGELDNGVSKGNVVNRIMNENEYLSVFVKSQYGILYQREGDTTGIDYWTGRMKNGLNQQHLIIEFLLSKEFWKKSIIEGYERRNSYPFSHN